MYISNSKRLKKVIVNLLRNPSFLIPYLKFSLSSKSPIELELPWWTFRSINKIKSQLNKEKTVFEWGSGGSSIFLAKYVKTILSVENDPIWIKKVRSKLKQKNLSNAAIIYREINLESPQSFQNSPYAKSISATFDIIIIDGEDAFGGDSAWSAREICFEISQKSIKKNGGIIIVDDSWRYPEILKVTKAEHVVCTESVGPCRKGVTSTDLHYY